MARVPDLGYILGNGLRNSAYMEHEGYMEKFRSDHARHTTYEFDTPSGIKKIRYVDLNIYIPLDVYTAIEKKEKAIADGYKDRKTLNPYEYDHLVKYFPDEKDKWNEVKETRTENGYMGRLEEFTTVVYKRASQGGGRRKQPKKKRKSRSTRRR